jgi:hypothetical protein
MTKYNYDYVSTIVKLVMKPSLISDGLDLDEYYLFAKRNKMRLLFLNSLDENQLTDLLIHEKHRLTKRKDDVNFLINSISNILNINNIRYSFFKTIRPYEEVTVDIDLIIYDDFHNTIMDSHNYNIDLLEHGPLSSTYRSNEVMMDIDFYKDVGVSYYKYLDNNELINHVIEMDYNDAHIKVLSPIADILSIVSHSYIKEQLYVLSEFFTYVYYVNKMSTETMDQLISLSKKWNLYRCLSMHNSISCYIYETSLGDLSDNMQYLKQNLLMDTLDVDIIKKTNSELPYKYNYKSVLKTLVDKLHDPVSRNSLLTQVINMLNPLFLLKFSRDFYRHITRETY